MAGLADLFGLGDNNGMFGGGAGGMYGDLLTPEMKQQMAFRGLMAAAGAFGQAAMPSRMPVPIGAALGQAASAMAGAQDQGLESALKAMLTGGKLQEIKAKIEMQKQLMNDKPPDLSSLFGPATPSGAPQPLVPQPVAPGADSLVPRADALTGPVNVPSAAGELNVGGALTGGSATLKTWLDKASGALPEGYRAVVTSDARPGARVGGTGGVSQHALSNAIDVQIIGPDGSPIPNKGEDTTGLYGKLAIGMHAAAPPEIASQLAWGGNFTTGPANGPRDLMHFDLAGDRGRFGTLAQMVKSASLTTPAQAGSLTGSLAAGMAGDSAGAPVQVAQNGPLTTLPSAPAQAPAAAQVPAPQPAQSPLGVDPRLLAYAQWAQRQARGGSALGIQTPGYIGEAASLPFKYFEPGANPALQGQIAGAQMGAQQPYLLDRDRLKADFDRRNELAKQGINLNPNGVNMPAPGFSEAMAAQKGAVAAEEAAAQQAAIQRREQNMARFNLDPNAIGTQPRAPVDVGGGLRTGGAAPQGAPPEAAGAPIYGPGVTEPLPTPHGTVIPPITEAAPIVGSPAYLKEKQAGPGGWAATENDWAATRPAMKKAEEAALVVADVLKTYQSGAFAGQLSDIRAKLRAVGIDLQESVAGDPAAAQRIVKLNFTQTITSMKGFDSNPAAYQIKLAFENWANTNLQPEANLAILGQTIGLARWQEKLQQDFGKAKELGWRDPQDFALKWDQLPQNSAKSFVERATQELGSLKGAPGAAPSGAPARRSYFDPKTGTIRPVE